jgi:tRNA (cmo5U34)-methyltransferase
MDKYKIHSVNFGNDEESSLGHLPKSDKWEFDDSVAKVFSDMLRRSIPQYEIMRDLINMIATNYIPEKHGRVMDLGSSRGDSIYILSRMNTSAEFLGVEISKPMLRVLEERFKDIDNVEILERDLRYERVPTMYSWNVVLSILTIQFIPIEYRPRIIKEIYDSLASGGVFVLVEKLIGIFGETDSLFNNLYKDYKIKQGYKEEEVIRKRLSLEGVLVPVSSKFNESMLTDAGFKEVECFWRYCNFAGWIARKI